MGGSINIAVSDLNADLKPDLAVVNRDVGMVTVLLNRGQEQFGSGSIIPDGVNNVSTLADIDNDGYADLIGLTNDSTTTYGKALYIYRNLRNGRFAPPVYQSLQVEVSAISSADLNNDGWTDLVTTNVNKNSISVILNNQRGLFNPPVHYTPALNISQAHSAILIDINQDGYTDIITLNSGGLSSSGFTVFINQRNGKFVPSGLYSVNYGHLQDYDVADMNGDGLPDISLLYYAYPFNAPSFFFTRLYSNQGNGIISAPTDYTLANGASTLKCIDLDADGRMDWLISAYSLGTHLIRNLGNGAFDLLGSQVIAEPGNLLTVNDMNDDSLPDLYIFSYGSTNQYDGRRTVTLWMNTGAGGFTKAFAFPLGFFNALATGDLNRDGRPDVLTGAIYGMYLWYNQLPSARWGIRSAKAGSWNEPQTWLQSRVPIATDHVLIRHDVQLPAAQLSKATRIGLEVTGRLHYGPNARLRIVKKP